LFRYDADIVDVRLLVWAQEHNASTVGTIEQAEQRSPGFTASTLSGIGRPEHFGPVSAELWILTYWLFAGGGVIVHPDVGASAKSVLAANVGHRPIAWAGVAYLSVWASVGQTSGQPVLVPFPQVADSLVKSGSGADFRQSREALHQAAIACVDRVNLVWPAALALAVNAAHSSAV
jgi:hypothetical protein